MRESYFWLKVALNFRVCKIFSLKIKKVFGYDIKEKTSDIIEVEFNPLIEDEPDNLIIYRKDRFVDLNIHSEVYDDKLYLLAFNNYLSMERKQICIPAKRFIPHI